MESEEPTLEERLEALLVEVAALEARLARMQQSLVVTDRSLHWLNINHQVRDILPSGDEGATRS
jgi:hypothetical protein